MFANARMYSTSEPAAQAWRALFEWIGARAEVNLEIIDYPPPQPLPALWARPDMGCAFMCGYPFALAVPRPIVLAAPVPGSEECRGIPVYWTDIVVRADSRFQQLTDIFGGRFAYTSEDSQSGYQSPRTLFAPYAQARGGRLFAETVGPLVTPRGVVDAVLAGTADAGPLDSYAHELIRAHDPEIADSLRIVASTRPIPIPPLVAAPGTAPDVVERLRYALLSVGDAAELATAVADLRLEGFVLVPANRYDLLVASARAADAQSYPRLA
jgi:ABC-type phosphate/phosphonate transport system substrate-binding protein